MLNLVLHQHILSAMLIHEKPMWEALQSVCTDWLALVGEISYEEAAGIASQPETPPDLALHTMLPDIQPDLWSLGLTSLQVRDCTAIFQNTLLAASTELQATFARNWLQIRGDEEMRFKSQAALRTIYIDGFGEEIARSHSRILELAAAAAAAGRAACVDSMKGDEANVEWTDETRALMERVYQQHPKLEAHEKKLLAEASGLSLRQISIWVSLHSSFQCARSSPLFISCSSWLLFSRCSCTDTDCSVMHLLDVRNAVCEPTTEERMASCEARAARAAE